MVHCVSRIKTRTFRSKKVNFQKTQKGQTQQITEKKKSKLARQNQYSQTSFRESVKRHKIC